MTISTAKYQFLNKASFYIILAFIFIHILNHFLAFISFELHINFMEKFRLIYRNIFFESILLICFIFHIYKIIKNIWKERKIKKTIFEKLIFITKIYLVYFLINHISAVLLGRYVFKLDTNIYYAITGLHLNPFSFYFIPYYFLSIYSIFFYMSKNKNLISFCTINILGFILALLLILSFKGVFYEINIPIEYINIYKF